MSNSSTVFVVDDDPSVRDALRWLLESVGLAVETFVSAADFLRRHDPDQPGCLVLDVRMPEISGLDLQDRLAAHKVRLPIIFVTGHGDVAMCVRAFEAGGFAFLEKPINHQQLLDYVQRAIEEDRESRDSIEAQAELEKRFRRLTPREREVMQLLVEGMSMKRIAAELAISVQTCAKHRSRILEKFGVDNDVELLRFMLTLQ